MLKDYMDKQELAYNLFVSDITNNCITHAYLIDENNYADSFNMVISFVKAILCENSLINTHSSDNCSLCKRIDDGNYPEMKIITPDGNFIKKQQIISLQQDFSRSAVEGKKRIYIIRDCEKMRPETANSMLKFLEEPEDNIIAILMTNNINNVLSTIISRCKVVKLNNVSTEFVDVDPELEKLAIDFVMMLETKGIETILSLKELWFSKITAKDREKMVVVFDKIIDIYYDVMKVIMGNENIKCLKFLDEIKHISKLNKIDKVLEKINILLEGKDSIKYNVNSNLFMDLIVISIGGINNGSRY